MGGQPRERGVSKRAPGDSLGEVVLTLEWGRREVNSVWRVLQVTSQRLLTVNPGWPKTSTRRLERFL
jgi:hypothetical protein